VINEKGGTDMFGGLIWFLLIGGFLFLMFRGGGCCGGHGETKESGGEVKDTGTEVSEVKNSSSCH